MRKADDSFQDAYRIALREKSARRQRESLEQHWANSPNSRHVVRRHPNVILLDRASLGRSSSPIVRKELARNQYQLKALRQLDEQRKRVS